MNKIHTLGAKEIADMGEAFLIAQGEMEYIIRAAKAAAEKKNKK